MQQKGAIFIWLLICLKEALIEEETWIAGDVALKEAERIAGGRRRRWKEEDEEERV